VEVITRVGDSPLGRTAMSFCRPVQLDGYVDHLWHSDGVIVDRRERVLPNGLLELVLTFDSIHRIADEDGSREVPRIAFNGLRSRPFVLVHPTRCDTLGIVLRPAGAFALLAQPLWPLRELTVDARDLLDREVDDLFERCAGTRPVAARFAVVARWLSMRISRAAPPDPAIAWMAAEIERGGPAVRIGELRKTTGLAKKRLAVRFRERVGVGPKLYARLVRFVNVLEELRREPVRLVDVALNAGYYDQAHMNTEFRTFAGLSPTAFLAVRDAQRSANTARDPG